ncbi:hypothetical protein D3P08_12245 [Paenibacillus nanensis]|uniref:SLH domain-containing protein n=1 Tax=Paenibacillus nanensis TaxID=393251 RepID=A0A3A1UW52_9BACL|nr:S-layer homology domain-containing protein [Paenibacillus nanensis]RIX52769.1 hypothetical protein D3P08_12245 [Paenibacillus nanensis]
MKRAKSKSTVYPKSLLSLMLALLLLLTSAPVYAAEQTGQAQDGQDRQDGSGGTEQAGTFVRLKNKWQSNFLYEDSEGVVRYGFPAYEDPSSHWVVEDYKGNKRFRNRATGHYITAADTDERREPLMSKPAAKSGLADQWTMHESNREGFVVIKSATAPPDANLVIHQEDQLGFAELSNDINITFESPQWALEPVMDAEPVRIANQFKTGQYLYEDAETGVIGYGDKAWNDAASHWFLLPGETKGSVKLVNRATGHYVTQGVDYEPIKGSMNGDTAGSDWFIEATDEALFVNFRNAEAALAEKPQTFVLNAEFPDDKFARSNSWAQPGWASAKWRIELAPEREPSRLAAFTEGAVSELFLYEEDGAVKYGAYPDYAGSQPFYQWVTEDYGTVKRIRNLATGHYMTREGATEPKAPLQMKAIGVAESGAQDQWLIANSAIYDDYKTIQSVSGESEFLHVKDLTGSAQAGAIKPDDNAAHWLFENPVATKYVRIQNDWQAFVLYEDENGYLKYGNVEEDDPRGHWMIERFNGRKRIQNRATGHYIHMENMKDGRITVSEVQDDWASALWSIEERSGSKLINNVADSADEQGQKKYINLQNLNKFIEYSVINPDWGSPKWKFNPVIEGEAAFANVRLKNKQTGEYLYEVTAAGEDQGKVKYGNLKPDEAASIWFMEPTGDAPNSYRLQNTATGHYIAMELVGADVEKATPPQQIIAQGDICTCWGSAKWNVEPAGEEGYSVFRSGWAGHFLYRDEQGYTKVSKEAAGDASAQFAVEPVEMAEEEAALPAGPIRIKNAHTNQYLYENGSGIVLYGHPASNDGYSHWVIEEERGEQRIRNRATGHYMAMTPDYGYIQSVPAGKRDQATHWSVKGSEGQSFYSITSRNGAYNDELIHVQNGTGYAERGLLPSAFGTTRWYLEQAPNAYVTPDQSEYRITDTATPVSSARNDVRLIAASAPDAVLYEQDGKVVTGRLDASDTRGHWLMQDFNGRKLYKNRATGSLLAANEAGEAVTVEEARGNDGAQWLTESRAGYIRLRSAAHSEGMLQLTASGGVHIGELSDALQGLWLEEPVASDQRYEAENAFVSDGATAFTVHTQEAGSYKVEIGYRKGGVINLVVNGLPAANQKLANAEAWSTSEIELSLRKGINTIKLQPADGDTESVIEISHLIVKDSVGPNYRGATVPYISYEAEHGNTNGELLGPSRVYKEIASEASGRQAVRLNKQGDYLSFRTTEAANALALRFVIPDSEDGSGLNETLSLYVDGQFRQSLKLSSKHGWQYGSYPWSNDPKQGNAHRFFAETHALIGDVPAGAEFKLQKDAGDKAEYYVIDLVELEKADAAYAKPDGYVSVTDFGAKPNDGQDDRDAFVQAMKEAAESKQGVWFPEGVFNLQGEAFELNDDIAVRGAGMWHTTLLGAKFIGGGGKIAFYDLLIDGDLNVRDDEALTHAFYGAFGPGSVIQNVWVEHSKTGLWLSVPRGGDAITDGLHMVGLRLRNLMADAVNFCVGTSNSLLEQSDIRYPGDDGIAFWSAEGRASVNNTARFNNVALPWLADNFAIFGGEGNKLQDNIGTDTITNGAGIAVSTRFNPVPFSGTTIVERNTLIRTGSADAAYGVNLGAIWLFAGEKDLKGDIIVRDNVALDSTYAGLIAHGQGFGVSGVTLQNIVLDGMGTNGIDVTGALSGSITADNVIIRGERIAAIADTNDAFRFEEAGEGFASLPVTFPDIQSHWARRSIEMLASEGIVKGFSAERFSPNASITRAQFAAMLVAALKLPTEHAVSFTDVDASAWYAEAVHAVASAGIAKGYEDGTFRPNDLITREEMAVLAAGAMGLTFPENGGLSFTDAGAISSWSSDAVAAAVEAELMNGKPDGTFRPSDNASRAEAAVLIARMIAN